MNCNRPRQMESYCVIHLTKEPIEWLKTFTRPGQMAGKQSVSQNFCFFPGPSFIAKYSCEREEKLFANF